MPDLRFTVEKAIAVPYAAAPQLSLTLGVTDQSAPGPEGAPPTIHAVALRCQVWIEPAKRSYSPAERERLHDLFGPPEQWGRTLRSQLWANTSVVTSSWAGSTTVELPLPCTFDFNVAAAKYFYALEDGLVPLRLMFSGTVFHETDQHTLQVAQVPWDREASFRLPVSVWKQMMDTYYPNAAWLCLRRDAFEGLYQFKRERGLPTWEAAIEALLSQAQDAALREKAPS